ncbi:hypothetical protein PVAP13_9NG528514 [Panicum virgatum]|uniref:Uncharacterized protein n=1 Tax=Panicum virgatum TaxID=38727 RepID=A0A8T0MST7_PANVG|nr:hypothetical protein PVAP13_9NG528514 [Panicum virgatum]
MLRLFFAYFNHRFSGNHRFNIKHDSGKSVSNLAHGRSEAFFHPIPLPPPVTPLLPILPCAAAPHPCAGGPLQRSFPPSFSSSARPSRPSPPPTAPATFAPMLRSGQYHGVIQSTSTLTQEQASCSYSSSCVSDLCGCFICFAIEIGVVQCGRPPLPGLHA